MRKMGGLDKKYIFILVLLVFIMGCAVGTYVKLPEDSILIIERGGRPAYKEGRVRMRPFPWRAAGGIPYTIERNSETIQKRANYVQSLGFLPCFGRHLQYFTGQWAFVNVVMT